jgi:hypothetical protein
MKRLFAAMTAALLVAALVPAAASGRGLSPITATGHAIQGDRGTCGNIWAMDNLYKAYRLTRVNPTTYNLVVNEGGPFTTIAGRSPGACESGTYNLKTVAAGVTGVQYQTFNVTVTSTTTPKQRPSCAGVNGCALSGDFLDAVFGSGNWTLGLWSFTCLYATRANGIWFDTSVNYPYNDRGDITGS